MTQLTTNTQAFIEAQQYSQFILDNIDPILLPEIFVRDVSDFAMGTVLNIKTVGDVVIQETTEDQPLVFNPIDTGNVTLQITDYVGDAWAITDELRRTGNQVDSLMGRRAMASTRALAQHHESRFLSVSSFSQTAADLNIVNSFPHRWVAGGAGGTNRVITLEDFAVMGLSFDEADMPQEGRIAIVPPVMGTVIETLTNLVSVSDNPMFKGIVETGFVENHRFVRHVYGWDVYVSTRLPIATATEALDASAFSLANDTVEVGDKPAVFMCIADDNTKPIMRAWRERPSVEGWRDHEERKDKFQAVSEFGFGPQRLDSLGVIWGHPTNRA